MQSGGSNLHAGDEYYLDSRQILALLGFQIPDKGVFVGDIDSQLYIDALKLLGGTINVDNIKDEDLLLLHNRWHAHAGKIDISISNLRQADGIFKSEPEDEVIARMRGFVTATLYKFKFQKNSLTSEISLRSEGYANSVSTESLSFIGKCGLLAKKYMQVPVIVVGSMCLYCMYVAFKSKESLLGLDNAQLAADINSIQRSAHLWEIGDKKTYDGISLDSLASIGLISVLWQTGIAVNPFGGDYSVAGRNTEVEITATKVPNDSCDSIKNSLLVYGAKSAICSDGKIISLWKKN